jgi:Fe-S-cluster containining protein
MLKSEAQRIAKATSKPVEEFAAKTKQHEPYAYEMKKTLGDAKCIFLRGNSCAIYECRPVICRFYPFEFRPADNGIDEFQHTEECLGIGKGEHVLRKAYFEGLLRKLAKASATCSKSESDIAFE